MGSSSKCRLGAIALVSLLSPSCDPFDAPPEITILGLKDGRLPDSKAPIDLAFSEPVDPTSLSLKIVRLQTDTEGNLEGDPEAAPGTLSPQLYTFPIREDLGGTGVFSENNTRFRITVNEKTPLPVGPSLALVVEPGLRDLAGIDTKVRRRFPFGYGFSCTGKTPPGPFTSGQYFFLVSVLKPLGLQVQLIADIRVDLQNGAFVGQFTNGDRIPDPNRCPSPCKSSEVCRLLPSPQCVAPSEKAGTVEEYPDYYANNTPPAGFSFTAKGCAEEQSPGVVTFGNEPVDAEVQLPKLTIKNIVLSGSFTQVGGQLRGTGTFTASEVFLGTISSGHGEGTFEAIRIPPDRELPNVPAPPAEPLPRRRGTSDRLG
ncbi:MAG: hypothetical protein RMJ98_18200 [Myxococcales bacterium]|nr:hypothetical protein [Polyangiaceae bacterium]MDW8251231.1 hypothetical protein [Myxococcales bacterium]